ncbi:hypothetical protein SAMN04487866_11248 [Thermoactinomyces sp. DSM 45891]|uniref:hypothetical protein n=1 Tax=Thermoactinomyces sp. DSM 45891 TaxID=1761907 RepID=UPI0009205C02|nr:hypothetical protein [Thermoactinomyces sp. DSM 45891]SFX57648.1 hypothetical protein SAMN04487866_11248 [Thermoactinomyces sp. DSM 45891]
MKKKSHYDYVPVRVLELDRSFYNLSPRPNHTIFINATAARRLGISPNTTHIKVRLGSKVFFFRFVLFTFPGESRSAVRFTARTLDRFNLDAGQVYPMTYDSKRNELTIIRGLL